VSIAAEAGADGVHLGQGDDSIEDARRFWGTEKKIFGLSTHSMAQALAAVRQAPDYIGIGPVFPTPTKAIPDPVLGLAQLRAITAATPLVSVPIGGIHQGNLKEVLACGSGNYAVVRAVTQSSDPVGAISALAQIAENPAETDRRIAEVSRKRQH
jgi:thiamine-phosphate pyrophosphorylase